MAASDAKAVSCEEPSTGPRTCQSPLCRGKSQRSTFAGAAVKDLPLGLAGFYQVTFRSAMSLESWH